MPDTYLPEGYKPPKVWKQDADNEEFKRLLNLVRGVED